MTLAVESSVDLKSIGWWLKDLDDKEHGPYSRDAVRQFQATGVISRDSLVRHNLDVQWQPVAEVMGVPEAVSGSVGQRLPDGKQASQYRHGTLNCVKHHDRPAITVCFRCHGPACEKCQYKTAQRMCKACHASLYNRRTVAGLIDYTLPSWIASGVVGLMVAGAVGGHVLAHHALKPEEVVASMRPAQMVGLFLNLVITAYLVFKERVISGGRSLGKAATGLRVVSFESGEPLDTPQCVKRNLLPLFYMVPLLNIVAAVWWIVDVSRAWSDPMQRRYFDKFSGTIVVDAPERLAVLRQQTAARISSR
ncbi:MAG: RDD family protein [Candidatus Xenobia bacterium]